MNFRKCACCEKDTPSYCEDCYQKLIAENAKLRRTIYILKKGTKSNESKEHTRP